MVVIASHCQSMLFSLCSQTVFVLKRQRYPLVWQLWTWDIILWCEQRKKSRMFSCRCFLMLLWVRHSFMLRQFIVDESLYLFLSWTLCSCKRGKHYLDIFFLHLFDFLSSSGAIFWTYHSIQLQLCWFDLCYKRYP